MLRERLAIELHRCNTLWRTRICSANQPASAGFRHFGGLMSPLIRNLLALLAAEIVFALPLTAGTAVACEWWATRK